MALFVLIERLFWAFFYMADFYQSGIKVVKTKKKQRLDVLDEVIIQKTKIHSLPLLKSGST